MNRTGRFIAVSFLATLALGLGAMLVSAPSPHAASLHHTVVPADAVAWGPGPPFLPPGAQAAVLLGNPGQEGPRTFHCSERLGHLGAWCATPIRVGRR